MNAVGKPESAERGNAAADLAAHATPTGVTVRGASAIIPQRLVSDGEVVILAIKPSLWYVVLVSGRWLAAALLLIIAAHMSEPWVAHRLTARISQLAVLISAVRLLIGMMDWLGRVYVLTDRRIMRLKGVIHIDLFECQLSRIQQVVLSLPLQERAVFCGTVLFYTAGTNSADAAWKTVSHPSAVYQMVLEAIEKYTRQNQNP